MENLAEVIYQFVMDPTLATMSINELQLMLEAFNLSPMETKAVYALLEQGSDMLQELQSLPGVQMFTENAVDWVCDNPANCIVS